MPNRLLLIIVRFSRFSQITQKLKKSTISTPKSTISTAKYNNRLNVKLKRSFAYFRLSLDAIIKLS